MQIHPHARWLLILGALVVAFFAHLSSLMPCFLLVAITYMLLGQGRSLLSFGVMVGPFVLVAGALWMFVYTDFTQMNFAAASKRLLLTDTNFTALLRTLTGTSVIYLALISIPDGEIYPVLRRMGAPRSAAFVFASGFAFISAVSEAFDRAVVALQAQGLLAPSLRSKVIGIGKVLSLTWLSGLSVTASRAEIKWAGNQFVDELDQRASAISINFRDTIIAALSAIGLVLIVLSLSNTRDLTAI
jgi:hypothetical protein